MRPFNLPFTFEQIVGAVAAVIAVIGIVLAAVLAPRTAEPKPPAPTTTTSTAPSSTAAVPDTTCTRGTAPAMADTDVPMVTDITGASDIVWDRCEQISETKVRVFFSSGNRRCDGQYAVVDERDDSVLIRIVTGRLANSAQRCDDRAHEYSMVIDLTQPLGDRRIDKTGGTKPLRPWVTDIPPISPKPPREVIPIPTVPPTIVDK